MEPLLIVQILLIIGLFMWEIVKTILKHNQKKRNQEVKISSLNHDEQMEALESQFRKHHIKMMRVLRLMITCLDHLEENDLSKFQLFNDITHKLERVVRFQNDTQSRDHELLLRVANNSQDTTPPDSSSSRLNDDNAHSSDSGENDDDPVSNLLNTIHKL